VSEVLVEQGVVLGFGGTNARRAVSRGGEIFEFDSIDTPAQPQDFFDWMGTQLLLAADAGSKWVVAGYPGPVSPDGRLIGPFKISPVYRRSNMILRLNLSQLILQLSDYLKVKHLRS
jgi:hypothetical protein